MILGLYSAGGFAREVKSSLQASLAGESEHYEIVFVDDDASKIGKQINGSRVVSYAEFVGLKSKKINVAFANPELRKSVVEKCEADNLEFFSLKAPSVLFGDEVSIGAGFIFAEHSMITANAVIGKHFHCNIYSYVAHDCTIGDFVTFAPRVSLNGRINVGNQVYIGSDATFLPGNDEKFLTVGDSAIVGAGAVVTKDVPAGSVVVGSPAKVIKTRSPD